MIFISNKQCSFLQIMNLKYIVNDHVGELFQLELLVLFAYSNPINMVTRQDKSFDIRHYF